LPHSSLGYLTPAEFAARIGQITQPVLSSPLVQKMGAGHKVLKNQRTLDGPPEFDIVNIGKMAKAELRSQWRPPDSAHSTSCTGFSQSVHQVSSIQLVPQTERHAAQLRFMHSCDDGTS
jgi:hypothetical protein